MVATDQIDLLLNPEALGIEEAGEHWRHRITLPAKRPFREAKIRINVEAHARRNRAPTLLDLLDDANEVRQLVVSAGSTSLNQIARRESRCRKQMARLLRVSWLILEGTQPVRLTRKWLLEIAPPIDWSEQERQLGLSD